MPRNSNRWASLCIALMVAASGVYAYAHFRKLRKTPDIPTGPARQGDFAVVINCRGSLTAERSVQLTAPRDVQDLQVVWLAPSGSTVHAGQIVVRFDPSKLQSDIHGKKVALDQAQATLDQAQAKARDTAGQDELDLAQDNYDAEKARLEASKQTIVSPMDGEKSRIDLSLAAEKVRLEQATVALHRESDKAIIASKARLRDEAKRDLDRTEARLVLMELKSPLDGVIEFLTNQTQGWTNAQPFKVGDKVNAGLPIAEIPDLSTLRMESKVDEADRGRINTGDQVRIHVDAFPERAFSGTLEKVSLLTEQSFNEWPPTHTFRAFASFKDRDPRLRTEMNGSADIVERVIRSAISVPARALFTLNGRPVVYVKTPDGFEAKHVRVQARNTNDVAVQDLPAGASVALADPRPTE